MFTSYFFVSCSRHSYADMLETLCDADFDLSYSYEFQCEDCASASEPDEGWSYYFEQNQPDSTFTSCEENMEWYLSAFHCCNDNIKHMQLKIVPRTPSVTPTSTNTCQTDIPRNCFTMNAMICLVLALISLTATAFFLLSTLTLQFRTS